MAKTITLHGHNYTVMSAKTQRAKDVWNAYMRSSEVDLRDAYGRCSRVKENAYEYCRAREREFNSYDGVITGHNSHTFSYAFTGRYEGKKYLIYITKDHDYAIDYEAI